MLLFWMYDVRSSHWPSKAFAPPTPRGPTMSGGLPDGDGVAERPHALASRANAVIRTPGRDRRWCMAPPPVLAPRLRSAAGDRGRRARRWRGSRRATGSTGRWTLVADPAGIGLPARTDHDPLDVVARAIAADIAPGKLDRDAVGDEGDAPD